MALVATFIHCKSKKGHVNFCRIVLHILLLTSLTIYAGSAASARNYENAACSFGQSRNYKGVCKPIQKCPGSLSNLHAGIYPVTCLFVGSESGSGSRTPLICCESDPRSRVSYQKCAEYSETTARNDKEAVNAAPTFLLPSNIPSSNIPKENEGWGSGSLETATVTPLAFVVGGEDARVGQFPYKAALGFGQNRSRISWLCGGTLVSDHHVLTAAHCLQEKRGRGKPTFVLIGDAHLKVDLNNRVKSRRVVPIDQITIHPNYNPSTKHNDIGLVKLRDKVVLSANVKPACLPQPVNRLEMGNNQSLLTAAGWGLTEFAGSPSETLQYVELRRQSSQRCVAAYSQESDGSSQEIIPSQFCAGAGEDDDIPKDTCDGDSGSGLTLKRVLDNINLSPRFVVGITSFGSKYCGLDKPGVYTNVQSFLDWLEDTIWPIDD